MNGSTPQRLVALRKAEAAVAEMEEEARRLRHAGRQAVGVVGRFELGPMSEALRASSLEWYPLVALSALGGFDAFFTVALTNAGGSISLHLGVPNLTLLVYIRLIGLAVAGLVALRVSRHAMHRSRLALGGAALAVVALVAASFARNSWALAAAALLASLGTGVAQAMHRPLLFDHYRPEVRVRALAAYTAGVMLAASAASVMTPVADALGVTWRSVFLVLAAVAAVGVLGAARLDDAAEASWETRVI